MLARWLPQSPLARSVALVSLVLTVAVGAFALWRDFGRSNETLVGGGFSLVDQHGQPRTDQDFRGRFMLVFFGFTNCPDICPVGLQTMSGALDLLGPKAEPVTPIFITVDPARDTSAVLRDYIVDFHPRLVALTGSAEAIGSVARAFRVYYAKATGTTAPSDPADYLMDHTARIYLMGADGSYVTSFEPGISARDMADRLAEAAGL